jgi:hypothetical protein
MKKRLLMSVIVGALFLLPLVAHATNGYVCRVLEYNYFGFGNNGGLLINFYSGAHCTGSYQTTAYACTTGSSDPVCSGSSYYTYSEAQLMAIMHELVESGRSGNQVVYFTGSGAQCKGTGGTNCLQEIDFYSN